MLKQAIASKMDSFLESIDGQEGTRPDYKLDKGATHSKEPVQAPITAPKC